MIIISHRGNLNGPNEYCDNNVHHINMLLDNNKHVEIDVWYIDNKWFIGHDKPVHNVGIDFLKRQNLWLHAKNIDAACMLRTLDVNYFSHDNDLYVLTSKLFMWVHHKFDLSTISDEILLNFVVVVLPEKSTIDIKLLRKCYAICTDYVCEY